MAKAIALGDRSLKTASRNGNWISSIQYLARVRNFRAVRLKTARYYHPSNLPPRAVQVSLPTSPSTERPACVWNALTAASV